MSNENCLAGMRCPKCGSYGPFLIQAKVCVLIDDDGVFDHFRHEWDNDSTCDCRSCSFGGTVADFDEDLCEVKEESDEEESAGV